MTGKPNALQGILAASLTPLERDLTSHVPAFIEHSRSLLAHRASAAI